MEANWEASGWVQRPDVGIQERLTQKATRRWWLSLSGCLPHQSQAPPVGESSIPSAATDVQSLPVEGISFLVPPWGLDTWLASAMEREQMKHLQGLSRSFKSLWGSTSSVALFPLCVPDSSCFFSLVPRMKKTHGAELQAAGNPHETEVRNKPSCSKPLWCGDAYYTALPHES